MSRTLSPELMEEALTRFPPPIADAVRAVECAESLHERRDRVVECFRALVRFVAAVAIAARVRDGPGPGGDSAAVRALGETLVRRGLTDGQWVALCRGLLRPWARRPSAHAVPALVRLFHGATRARLARNLDGLLAMRRVETVAHGGTGDRAELAGVLERRLPQLEAVLALFAPLFRELRVVVPLRGTGDGTNQPGILLAGDTPGRGGWRRLEIHRREPLPAGEALLLDAAGRPVLALFPGALVRGAAPGAREELYLIDSFDRGGARFAALPGRSEHPDLRARDAIEGALCSHRHPSGSDTSKLAERRAPRASSRAGWLAASVLAGCALVLSVAAWWSGSRVPLGVAARGSAIAATRAALDEEGRERARALQNRAVLERARAAMDRDPTEAMVWLAQLDPDGPGAGEARVLAVDARRRGVARHVLVGHAAWISALAYSPDSSLVASGDGDGTIVVCSASSGSCSQLSGHSGAVLALAISPDGTMLASGGADASVRLWESRDGVWTGRSLEGHSGWVESVCFSPDGAFLASGGRDAGVRVWATSDGGGTLVGRHDAPVSGVEFAADADTLVSTDASGTEHTWTRENGELRWKNAGSASRPRLEESMARTARAPDGSATATAGGDGSVRFRDARSGVSQVLRGHVGRVTEVVFSPDGKQLASGGVDGQVRLWDRDRGAGRVLGEHAGISAAVAWSADGERVASGGFDHLVMVWDWTATPPQRRVLRGHDAPVHSVAFAPAGDLIASAGADGTVRLWNLDTDRHTTLWRADRVVWHVAFSPDGRQLAATSDSGEVRVWRRHREAGRPEQGWVGRHLGDHALAAVDAQFSPDGRWLASAGWDGALRLWSLAGSGGRVLAVSGDVVARVAWSPDARYLAAAGWEGSVLLHDRGAAETVVLRGHEAKVLTVAFSPDGRRVASASSDGSIRVWRTADAAVGGQAEVELRGHQDEVTGILFTSDGAGLVSASRDHTVRLWDIESGQGGVLGEHAEEVGAIALAPDGRNVASVGDDHSVRLWPVDVPREPRALRVWLERATTATTQTFAAPRRRP